MSLELSLSRVSSLCDAPSVSRAPSMDRMSSLCFPTESVSVDRLPSRVDRSSSLCFPGPSEGSSSLSSDSPRAQSSLQHAIAPPPAHSRGPDKSPPVEVSGKFDPSLHNVTTTFGPSGLTALVLDCGVGQTKALVLTYREGVSVRETRTAPAVVEFLGARDDLRGSPLLQAVEGDAVHPFFFLDHKPSPSATPVPLQPEHFLQFVQEVREECKAEICFIGTSQWHQEVDRPASKMVEQLSQMGVVTQRLTRSQEASFECAAIQYACAESGVQDLVGSIGSGGGSVQCFRGKENFNLEIGWRTGVDRLIHSGGGGAALREFDLWWGDTVNPAFKAATALLKPEQKLRGSVLCTSACYYAAKLVGKASHSAEMRPFLASDVRIQMQRKRQELMNLIRSNEPIKDHAMDLCNLSLHIRVLEEVVADEAQLLYKRDWLLPGGREFRTTWTAGWYLFFLKSRGVDFPSCDHLLDLMAPGVVPPQPKKESPPEPRPPPPKSTASVLEMQLQAIEDEIASRVLEARNRKPKLSNLGTDASVCLWVETLPKLAQFAPLFVYTQWEQIYSFGLADFMALGLPLAAAVPLAKALQQRRQSLLQDGSVLAGADWPSEDDVISLNVGGALFSCRRVTLLQSSRVRALLQENPHKRHFFVDRDGKPFAWILSYLRTSSLIHVQEWDIFLQEVEFFGVKLPAEYSVLLSFKVPNVSSVRDPRALLQSLATNMGLGGSVSWSGLFALQGKLLFPLDHLDVLGALRSVRRILGSWDAECLSLVFVQTPQPMEFSLPSTSRHFKNSHSPVRKLRLAPNKSEAVDALNPDQVARWLRLTSLHAYESVFLDAKIGGKDLLMVAEGKFGKKVFLTEDEIATFTCLLSLLQRELESGFEQ